MFISGVNSSLQTNGNITFRELYHEVYKKVTGSHVRTISTGNFNLNKPVSEYLKS